MATSSASSEAETAALAARLALTLRPGAVVFLRGDLGSGKTAFVRGAARALGVTGAVTSPTYTVAHLYDAPQGPVAHLDLSRSERLDEASFGDLESYFDGARATFVEWPDAGLDLLPAPQVEVHIEVIGPDLRRVRIDTDREI